METDASTEFMLPQPSPEGIEGVRKLYLEKKGKEITEDEGRQVLTMVMRWQYLNFLINSAGRYHGNAPLGFRLKRDESGPVGLEPDPVTGPLVRKLFEDVAGGLSLREASKRANEAGLRSSRGNPLGPSSMLKLLRNRLYAREDALGPELYDAAKAGLIKGTSRRSNTARVPRPSKNRPSSS